MGRSRSRSRSPRRDRDRERKRSGERDSHRDRHRRDHDRHRRRSRDRRRSRSRSPRRRSRSPRGRDDRDRKRSRDKPKPHISMLVERKALEPADFEGKTEEEIDMMKTMGFGDFDTTKGKQVKGNEAYQASVQLKRKYRQYMNRRGGFNRPLDFIA